MREFFAGLIFLLVLTLLVGAGFLLFPVLMLLALLLRVLFIVLLCLFGIWLLGKLVLAILDEMKGRR